MNNTELHSDTSVLNVSESTRLCVLIVLLVLFTVGFVGNILTLLALPYVRRKYGPKFTVLQSSTAILLLHLSFCDLLYIVIGFTHFIHVIIIKRNPFSYLGAPYSENLCYAVAFLRNLAAEADFATMGAIAICVCRHKLCRQCRNAGNPSYHSQHNDLVFGSRGIYFTIIFIWIWSFLTIVPDAFSLTSKYKWTNTIYGCDVTYTDHISYGMIVNIVVNLIIIFISYGILARQLMIDQSILNDELPVNNSFTKHIKMLICLSIAYTVCILPASTLSWGMFNTQLDMYLSFEHKQSIQAVSSCLYWSMYGLNFLLYIATSERLRSAYKTFLKDFFHRPRQAETQDTLTTWWAGLNQLSFGQKDPEICTKL